MRLWRVVRKDNSEVIVGILPHKLTGKFSYINLTKEHICPCQFDSVEDALQDMKNDPFVVSYHEIKGGDIYA